jgi:hypothetical protein
MEASDRSGRLRGDAGKPHSGKLNERTLMVGKLRTKFPRPTTFLRLAYSAPTSRKPTLDEMRRFKMPATKSLPFVKLKANDQPMWFPESLWHVEPTGKRENDVRRGRKYARNAIAAMKADQNHHLIAYIMQDIIKDAIQRSEVEKGRTRRNAVVLGFLSEISEAIAATQSHASLDM